MAAVTNYNERPDGQKCWNCDAFYYADPDSSSLGFCHLNPPVGHYDDSDPPVWISDTPPIPDGCNSWCGQFKRRRGAIPPER